MSESEEQEQVITNQPLRDKRAQIQNAQQIIQDDGSSEACMECCCVVAETSAEIASDSINDGCCCGVGDCDCGDCSCFCD